MTPEQERELKEFKEKLEKLESILFGTSNDPRFQSKVREQVIGFTPSTGKPFVTLKNGDRYEITTVTKLN